jgi:hypothetical protein
MADSCPAAGDRIGCREARGFRARAGKEQRGLAVEGVGGAVYAAGTRAPCDEVHPNCVLGAGVLPARVRATAPATLEQFS